MPIRFSFFGTLLLLTLLVSNPLATMWGLAAALCHELGHALFGKLCGIRLRGLRLGLFGARLQTEGQITSYPAQILLCLGGPAVNLLICLLLWHAPQVLLYFRDANLCLALLNLLPVQSLDGGRILYALLSLCTDPHRAFRLLRVLSFLCLLLLWGFSMYLLMRTGLSLSPFLFSMGLFRMLFLSDHAPSP